MLKRNAACMQCAGPHPFDTSVPSVQWNRVIRGAGLPDYLCLTCIVAAFAKIGESFTAQLWGSGFEGLSLEFRIEGAAARSARLMDQQNCQLRSTLSQVRDLADAALDDVTRAITRGDRER